MPRFFSIMESSSYDRNVMLRGIAMRRKKRLSQKFFRRKAAADAALGSIAGAGLNPAAEKQLIIRKVKIRMRKYKSDQTLDRVICNGCGRKLVVEDGILREGAFSTEYSWDYFSEKDG